MMYAGLSDDAWRRVRACLEEHPGLYVKQKAPTRRFVEAVLWMARAGAPWRILPAAFGPWNSVYKGSVPPGSLIPPVKHGLAGSAAAG